MDSVIEFPCPHQNGPDQQQSSIRDNTVSATIQYLQQSSIRNNPVSHPWIFLSTGEENAPDSRASPRDFPTHLRRGVLHTG